jgi:hypothetical protein
MVTALKAFTHAYSRYDSLEVTILWRDNLGENGAAIRMRSGGRNAS